MQTSQWLCVFPLLHRPFSENHRGKTCQRGSNGNSALHGQAFSHLNMPLCRFLFGDLYTISQTTSVYLILSLTVLTFGLPLFLPLIWYFSGVYSIICLTSVFSCCDSIPTWLPNCQGYSNKDYRHYKQSLLYIFWGAHTSPLCFCIRWNADSAPADTDSQAAYGFLQAAILLMCSDTLMTELLSNSITSFTLFLSISISLTRIQAPQTHTHTHYVCPTVTSAFVQAHYWSDIWRCTTRSWQHQHDRWHIQGCLSHATVHTNPPLYVT